MPSLWSNCMSQVGLAASTNSEGSSISSSHSAISWWMCRLVRLSDLMDVVGEQWMLLMEIYIWNLNPEQMALLNFELHRSFLCFSPPSPPKHSSTSQRNHPSHLREPRERTSVQYMRPSPYFDILSGRAGSLWWKKKNVFLDPSHYWLPIRWNGWVFENYTW